MKVALSAVLLSGLAVQQAAAQYGWGNARSFPNPFNCDNKCTPDQKSGFNWGDLPTGDFGSYKDFDFSGFSCKDKFSKRSLDKRTGFQDKCIEGKMTKSGGGGGGGGPKFSCGKDKAFSISKMEVSVSFDTDVNFIYEMPDGSKCKHTSPCRAGGSVVKNTQCGGAKSVHFELPSHSEKGECDFGLHHVDFDCTPGEGSSSSSTTASSTTESSSKTSSMTTTPSPSESPSESLTTPSTTFTTSGNLSVSMTSPSYSETPSTTSTTVDGVPTSSTTPETTPVETTPAETTPAETTPIPSSESPTKPGETPGETDTVTTTTTDKVCPVCETTPPPPTSPETSAAPPPTEPSGTPPPAGCPSVLPSCLNSFLSQFVASCKSNSDASCYCPSAEYTGAVIECIQSWAASEAEVRAALSYFMGICAPYVEENPGVVTAIPTSITLVPAPAPTGAAPTMSTPYTTITVSSSTITVPQVEFVTATAAPVTEYAGVAPTPGSTEVGLIPGTTYTPPPPPAPTGEAAPVAGVSTLATSVAATNNVTAPTASGPAQFTGAASRQQVGVSVIGLAMMVMALAL